ncbi:hypothetical protein ABT116_47315, partial [Streptomyces sp. NPDC002130]|uniref:hypothetical protein n=1 Tax=Streptomyces sp. NPDC002130 TaxID=3155568 RepID=UPI00332EA7B5
RAAGPEGPHPRRLRRRGHHRHPTVDHLSSNFAEAIGRTFPADLPILLFAVQNSEVEGWTALHEGQAASVDHGELVLLDGDHYLHHTKSKEIAENVNRFMGELN